MFSAKINGIAIVVPECERLKLTGEKFTWTFAGLLTVNCHHGTNNDMAIKAMLEIPAANATKFIFVSIIIT